MNETRFWRWLSDRLPPGHYTRIESACSPGLPDVWCAWNATPHGGWIELKAVPRSRYPFKRRGLRAAQSIWIANQVRRHVRVHLVATTGSCFGIWNMATVDPYRINAMDIDQLEATAVIWTPRKKVGKSLDLAHFL